MASSYGPLVRSVKQRSLLAGGPPGTDGAIQLHRGDELVPLSGVIATAGGLSVALGYQAKIGGWLLFLFLVPVTLMMHNFWAVTDPMMHGIQLAMFMKNVSMLGGALLITHFGAGPLSLDARLPARATPGED